MANFVNEGREKLLLKVFIKKHLDENTFDGFEWLSHSKRYFKIPWADKNKPGYEVLHKICQEWALNKDGEIRDERFSQLKQRFRDALRNSNFFEKDDNQCVKEKQTGNYDVYCFLTNEQANEKKLRTKKKISSDSSATSSPSNSQEVHTMEMNTLIIDDDMMNLSLDQEVNACIKNPIDDFLSEVIDRSGCLHEKYIQEELMQHQEISQYVPHHQDFSMDCTIPQFSSLTEFLEYCNCDIPIADFSKFEVTVMYEKDKIMNEIVDLGPGHFFHSSFFSSPANNLNLRFPVTIFPDSSAKLVAKVLMGLKEGFALQYTDLFELFGLRFCNSLIFYFNSENENNGKKMKRDSKICLFSYYSYIIQLLNYRSLSEVSKPSCEVMLSIGLCPKTPLKKTVISLHIKPHIAKRLDEFFGCYEGSVSLKFSDKNSCDSLIRSLTNIQKTLTDPEICHSQNASFPVIDL